MSFAVFGSTYSFRHFDSNIQINTGKMGMFMGIMW